jgi:serine/threonine protein kinase
VETSPDLLMSIFLQILDGVQEAHLRSIWHRDLKPENILYDPITNSAVVTDFGIAHFAEDLLHTTVETRNSDRLANFRYAAPEQRANKKVDQRADIYALGLILYEMFTGELLQGTAHKQIGSVTQHFAYLDSVVEKMSRQSPDDRPTSIGEIKEALSPRRASSASS